MTTNDKSIPASDCVLLTRDAFLGRAMGHGWLETWLRADDEDPEQVVVVPFAWAGGYTVCEDGISNVHHIAALYNRRHGCRVWVGERPTWAQRDAAAWEGGERPCS